MATEGKPLEPRHALVWKALPAHRQHDTSPEQVRAVMEAMEGLGPLRDAGCAVEEMRDAAMRTVQAMGLIYIPGSARWRPNEGHAPAPADERAAETLPAELVERILRLWEDYPGAEFADRLRAMRASGDAAAPAYAQGSDELQPRTPGEKAAYLEGVEEGRMRAVRDGQVMGSGEEVLRRLLRARGLLREFVDHGLTTSRVQRARELLEDGQ